MHQVEHIHSEQITPSNSNLGEFMQVPEMHLYTRYEHGNRLVRVYRDEDGETVYELALGKKGKKKKSFTSARALMRAIYGHDIHMPFDRYFRLGRYRQAGRGSGQADLLTLLEKRPTNTRRTDVVVHSRVKVTVEPAKQTEIIISPTVKNENLPSKTGREVQNISEGEKPSLQLGLDDFIEAMGEDLLPQGEVVQATPEIVEAFERVFRLELDRLEGIVGIDLGAESSRKGVDFKADEVRKLLWRGFAGKMLSRGYDPEDVLQEVYRGLLVRNQGTCPWDSRKSTFGHYVHMVISCVLMNYHRKQARRADKDAISLDLGRDGEDLGDIGQWGSCGIEYGTEYGDMLALEDLNQWLERVSCDMPEAVLGRRILPLVAAGHQRQEIVEETGVKPSMVSRALTWLRKQTAEWASSGGLNGAVPSKYRACENRF